MNYAFYENGNSFRVRFKKHYCYNCGSKLSITKLSKIVNRKSPEAELYFNEGLHRRSIAKHIMIGDYKFVHKAFYCPQCSDNIEFITQTSLEDVDILIEKVEKYFNKKGRNINIKKYFVNTNNQITQNFTVGFVSYLLLSIEERNRDNMVYRIPISRMSAYDRPFYFNVNKKDVIKFIKQQMRFRK